MNRISNPYSFKIDKNYSCYSKIKIKVDYFNIYYSTYPIVDTPITGAATIQEYDVLLLIVGTHISNLQCSYYYQLMPDSEEWIYMGTLSSNSTATFLAKVEYTGCKITFKCIISNGEISTEIYSNTIQLTVTSSPIIPSLN